MATITIDKEAEGMRLDRFLRKHLKEAALSYIYKMLREGTCKLNSKKAKQDARLKAGDVIEINVSDDEYKKSITNNKTPTTKRTFDIIYEDENIMIVNKPPFLASQPGTGVEKNNLINQVKTYLKDAKTKPALANRLDRGTSGIVVVGKNRAAILALFALFKERRVEKTYLALVHGIPKRKAGTIHSHLRRVTEHFQHKMLVLNKKAEGTVEAETKYRVIQEKGKYALLELNIVTGKMHQIRAQLASIGHPIVGDKIYGNKELDKPFENMLRRQFLHANKIRFEHPFTKKIIEAKAELTEDIKKALKKVNVPSM